MKLTKRMVDSLKAESGRDVVVWDDELRGFGLRIKPSGRKTYIVQYRNAQGRSRRVTVGQHGRLTPEEARIEARQMLAAVDKGEDPAEIKAEGRRALTVADLAERYMAEHAEVRKKPRSVKEDKRLLRDIILPALGKRKVADVTRADMSRLHHELRQTPIQANRTLALASKMFSLAEAWGLRPGGSNPCRGIERYKEIKRKRYLSGEELARLGKALAEAEAGGENPAAILAIRLLLFTGARLSEILALKWDYVDFERGVLDLPDSKTGAKIIPLNAPALEVLEAAPRLSDNPYVCPGEKPGGHLVGIQRPWQRIRAKAGLPGVRLHDLRHSYASAAAAAGLALPLIGALLGHTQPATTARYAHLALDPLKAAAEEVGRRIDQAMKARPKVVSLRRPGR